MAEDTRREIFLIDGNSLAYRAFFALPETIATSQGMPTNAIFGFASMLVKILTEFGPKATLVAWDAGMSGRELDYDDYKSQRAPRPDLLSEQWPHLAPLVEAFGYTNVKVPGYEADDVIATLARRAHTEGMEVMIVTGDRDALQLVEPGVRVMTTSRGITDTKIYDRATVIERYGIPPELVADFIALKGDSSDNIPGVPGIGDKTAAQLLQQFGDLETVLASVDQISGAKRKQSLVDHAEDARMSRRLATAIRDVEIDVDLERCLAEPDRSQLREVFQRFELRDPLRRLEEALGDGEAAAPRARPVVEMEVRAIAGPVSEISALDGALPTLAAGRRTSAAADGDRGGPAARELGLLEERHAQNAPAEQPADELDPPDQRPVDGFDPSDPGPAGDRRRGQLAGDLDSVGPALTDAELAEQIDAALMAGSEIDELDGRAGTGATALRAGPLAAVRAPAGSPRSPLAFSVYAGGDEVLVGEAETLAGIALAWGDAAVVTHDWKTLVAPEAPCDLPPLGHDTMVAAYLIDPARRRYPLDELAEQEGIGVAVTAEEGFAMVAERAVLTRALAERQLELLAEGGLSALFRDVELPLVEILIDMERAGIQVDRDRLGEIASRFAGRIAAYEREIWLLAGEEFTIGSPQQLAEILFERLALPRKRRGKTGFSTDARVLAAIRGEHPIVEKVERWRELTKLKSTYLDALPDLIDARSGRLHTTFNQTATATGRLSSTNPNLQNIPIRSELGREIRACFVAAPGTSLLSADYSQVELRVLADICGEDVLKEIFRRGDDVHAATAAEIFGVPPAEVDAGLRSKAKMVNFGIVYGLSAFGMADRLQMPHDEAADFIERYLNRFPKVRAFIDETIARATVDGYVTTLFGRIRRIPELRARQHQTRMLGERLAVNTVIQGTAADIIKVAMVRCCRALREAGLATRLVLQIHDELLFEAPAAELDAATEIVRIGMTTAVQLDPPLVVDVGSGPNWLEAK